MQMPVGGLGLGSGRCGAQVHPSEGGSFFYKNVPYLGRHARGVKKGLTNTQGGEPRGETCVLYFDLYFLCNCGVVSCVCVKDVCCKPIVGGLL